MQNNKQEQREQRIRINHLIRVPQVRVVGNDGSNLGIMATRDALKMAQEQYLDLIEINPKGLPPVCKIADYGKMKYEEKKKMQLAKKTQQVQELKELTFRPNTDENDLTHKLSQAKEFLNEGHRVKFTIRFRGREIAHPHVGSDKLDWLLEQLSGSIAPAAPISLEGKFMSLIVAPIKK